MILVNQNAQSWEINLWKLDFTKSILKRWFCPLCKNWACCQSIQTYTFNDIWAFQKLKTVHIWHSRWPHLMYKEHFQYLLFLFFRLRYCSYLKDCLLSFLYADREMSLIFIDVFMFMWNGCWGICSQTNKLVHNRKSLIYSAVFTKNTYIHLHLIWASTTFVLLLTNA